MNFLSRLLFGLLLIIPFTASAELPQQLESDFASVSGYIIMPVGNEFLVDLDATQNLQEGDILTLVTPGEKVVHPISKEVLGSLDIAKGYLIVTRIKSGYSYAKLVVSETAPQKGDQVRRYEQVPVRFEDKQGDGAELQQQLVTGLPQLNWLAEKSSEQPLLTFTLENKNLSVKSSAGNVIRSYPFVAGQLSAPAAPVQPPSAAMLPQKEPKILEKAVNTLINTISSSNTDRGLEEPGGKPLPSAAQQSGVWMGPSLQGNPVGVAVADLDGDGTKETAIAFDNKLLIAEINQDQYLQKADVSLPGKLQLLSLDALDLDNNGRAELYLTAVLDHKLASFVVEYTGEGYVRTIDNIRWYLRVAEFPERGRVLIGQKMGTDERSFSGKPFFIQRDNNRLLEGEKFSLPGLVNIYSFTPFTDDENKLYYAYLSKDDYLKVISADGTELWESADYFGGTETSFANRKEHDGDMVETTYIPSRLLKMPNGEILVAQNEGLRTLQRFRKFKESRLLSMSWNGYSLVENWRTHSQSGYLGDFVLADANNDGNEEIVMAIKFKHKGLLNDARSTIVTYDLN